MNRIPIRTNRYRPTLSGFLWILITCFFLFACGESNVPTYEVESAVVQKKPKKTVEAPSPDRQKTKPLFSYHARGRRDPFKPLLLDQEISPIVEEAEIVNELQKYELNSLKIVGIIWNQTGNLNLAVIETPNGKGYSVEEGTPIGKGSNQIKKITPEGIIVHQRYRNIRGEIESREVELSLKKKGEG